jgi:hypothetical protein
MVVNLVYCAEAAMRHGNKMPQVQIYALGAFGFVITFQIGLCLMLGCSGISIIWCAMASLIMSERRRVIHAGCAAYTTSFEDLQLIRNAELLILVRGSKLVNAIEYRGRQFAINGNLQIKAIILATTQVQEKTKKVC